MLWKIVLPLSFLTLFANAAGAACGADCADCYRYHNSGAICEENKVSLLGACKETCIRYKPSTSTSTSTSTKTGTSTSTDTSTSRDAR